jgi:hypothetical protein
MMRRPKRVNQNKTAIGKRKAILERIRRIEQATLKAKQYLETGEHAHWHGFRSLFTQKSQNGELCPPHKDWVKNVFLPHCEQALRDAEKLLE